MFLFFGSVFLAGFIFSYSWYRRVVTIFAPSGRGPLRFGLGVLPVISLALFLVIFWRVVDPNVKAELETAFLFSVAFLFSQQFALLVCRIVGVDPLADTLERGNAAVVPIVTTAFLGAVALNIGANVGSGEEESSTLFPLTAGLALWAVFATVLAGTTSLVESATLDRNRGAGWCFGTLWFCASLILARCAAGDWVSFAATVTDFAGALPVLLALLIAARGLAPSISQKATVQKSLALHGFAFILTAGWFFVPPASTWSGL